MLVGIGIDVVETQRFERMLNRFGVRVAQRILTELELLQFNQRNQSIHFLATRFAAKEAASKALGTGIAKGVTFRSIEVVNNKQGKPELLFHAGADRVAQQLRVTTSMLSISDEKKYAVAMVVLESC